MLRLTWVELFLRCIPELFIIVWGVHVISRKTLDIPKYISSSIVLGLVTFFVRWLPIYLGVHMIINVIMIISIMVIINIPLIKAIYSTLLMIFMLSLSEFLNMMILSIPNINTNINLLDPVRKCIYCYPSLIFLVLFILLMSHLLKLKEGNRKCL